MIGVFGVWDALSRKDRADGGRTIFLFDYDGAYLNIVEVWPEGSNNQGAGDQVSQGSGQAEKK